MNIKNILKETTYHFKKDIKTLIFFSIASSVIVSSILTLQNIITSPFLLVLLTIALAIVVVLLIGTSKYVSFKITNGDKLDNDDFYFGFKNSSLTLLLLTSEITGPFLCLMIGLSIGIVISGIGLFYYLINTNPSIINSIISNANMDEVTKLIYDLPYIQTIAYIVTALTTIIALLFTAIFSLKRIYSFNIKLETIFSLDNCNKMSEDFVKKNRSKSIVINMILALGIFVIFAFDTIVNELLLLTGLNILFANLITDLLRFFLLSLFIFYFELLITNTYIIYLQTKVRDDNAKLIEKLEKISKR